MGSRVALIGMAAVFPGAPDVETFWQNIVDGVDAIGEVPADRIDPVYFEAGATSADRFYCSRGGFIDAAAIEFDPTEFGIMPVAAEEAEPEQLLALATAQRALQDAGYPEGPHGAGRTGIIIGRGGYINPALARLDQRVRTSQQLVECLRELAPELDDARLDAIRHTFQDALGPSRPETSIGLVPNLVASRVANRLDLHGPAYTVDAACASSLIAVSQAVDLLASGRCDVMLAGGVHHCHDVTLWSVFSQLRALSPTQGIRPFDRRADGLLIGEGTGLVVLKRLEDAERDGDRIYAVIEGIGVSSDGRASTLMSPAVEGEIMAVEQAWADAGMDPTTVGLIEAHGTATPVGDAAELSMINKVFGRGGSGVDASPVGLGSVKSMIGHAMPACGIAGLIKGALAAHHGIKPPTLHGEEPHAELEGTRFHLVSTAEDWATTETPRRVGVSAFGFGGINAHAVIQAHDSAPSGSGKRSSHRRRTTTDTSPASPVRLFVAEATTAAELLDRLGDEQLVLAGTDLSAFVSSPATPGSLRLAIADPTPKRVELARRVVERGSAWRGRSEIWFTPNGLLTEGGKLAFAFPGVEPNFAADVDDVTEHFGISVPRSTLDTEIGHQSLSIIWLGRLLSSALREIGVEPDVILGHSLGEWTAMIESEVVPTQIIDEYLDSLVAPALPDLVFLAVGCGADQAAAAIADLDDIAVSHDNCPHQAIVCGTAEAVAVAQARLATAKVLCQELPFRTGFHTPMFAPYLGWFVDGLSRLPMQAGRVPLWSACTAAPFPSDAEGIRTVCARLYTEPVRFRQLVENLYDDGVRVFVQPGLGSVTGFVDDTLHDRPHLAVAASTAKRSGLAQLACVAASLWVEGATVALDRLAPRPGHTGAPAVEPDPDGPTVTRPDDSTVTRPDRRPPTRSHLRFDAALVRADLAPLPRSARPGDVSMTHSSTTGAGSTAVDRFNGVLRTIAETGHEVLTVAATPAPVVPVAPLAKPAVGRTVDPSFVPHPPIVEQRRISTADHPELRDHAFFEQADDWPEPEDRFVVVPMTMMVEMMAAFAQQVEPGRVVVGLENIRALRWLVVEPAAEVTIEARHEGPGRVRVSIEGYARSVVLLADRYDTPPAPDRAPLADEAPALHSARELYVQKWMFHGPAYHGISRVDTCGSDGVRGEVTALAAPGALLDAAGQLLGYWAMLKLPKDRLVLPMRIDRIDFYGPAPEVGTRLDCSVRFDRVTDTEARGDIDLVLDGALWGRLTGFVDHRFETTDALFPAMIIPEENHLAEPRDGYWVLREQWHSAAMRELLMRRYLGAAEREEYLALTPKRQRSYLLGRMVLKDAVRQWLAASGAGVLYPAQVAVSRDALGRPIVTLCGPIGGQLAEEWTAPAVSLSHKDGCAVASVSADADTGIDLEPLQPWTDAMTEMVLTPGELALGAGRDPEVWATTAWTVKEAVGKARGTGLQGRPKDIEITEVDGAWTRVDDLWIHTTQEDGFVVSTVRRRG